MADPPHLQAIAWKVNLFIGHTKESLAQATGQPVDKINENEVDAVILNGDSIESFPGWEWDTILKNTNFFLHAQ